MSLTVTAQAPRSSFGLDNYSFSHELNPAITPDSSYWSLPLIGNASVSLSSTMKLGDLFYDKDNGTITTFMNSGTISKSDLMNRVGSGMNTGFDMRVTLASVGRRVNENRYQTFSLALRTQADVFLDKGLFDVMKEVDNRLYQIGHTSVNASSYMEMAYGENRSLNDKWHLGLKAKVLLGIINADADVENMNIDLSTGKWIAQGKATMNVSGMEYKLKKNDYKGKTGTYSTVDGFKLGTIGLRGVGVAVDAGASYKHDDSWTFSAAVLDLGFISWFNSRKAENNGKVFEFDGFHDISASDEGDNSMETQWNNLADQFMDMAHVEETTKGNNLRMLACTVNAGATYRYDWLTASALLTSRIYGRNTSVEGRLNLSAKAMKCLDVTVSPAYSSYGFALGGLLRWQPGRCQVYVGTDCFFLKMNKQFIPTSMNTSFNIGMTMPM